MTDVYNLLLKNGEHPRISGQDYLINCLNPDHEDNNPSLRINQDSGIFNCLSCGFKGNLFKHYGVVTSRTSVRTNALKKKLNELKTMMIGLDYPLGSVPWTTEYRGISKETIIHFKAFKTTKVKELEDRIIFPITDASNKIQVFVGRQTLGAGYPRYLNHPRGVVLQMFPVVMPKETKQIFLVEGLFDMLNMWDKGAKNTVCTFGTNTLLKDLGAKLLPYKAQGIEKVVIVYDADEAGKKAAKTIKPLIEAEDFLVEILSLEDGQDPGDLTEDQIQSIIHYNGRN
jgi:DNA primase